MRLRDVLARANRMIRRFAERPHFGAVEALPLPAPRRVADKRDERASFHSITSSACASKRRE
jgi:hypothetical protein